MLDALQHDTFRYFLHEVDAASGLRAGQHRARLAREHRCRRDGPGCLADRRQARLHRPRRGAARTLTTLRFFWNAPQGPRPTRPAKRASTITSSTCRRGDGCGNASVYDRLDIPPRRYARRIDLLRWRTHVREEIRSLADALYRRVDWQWARNGGAAVTHGWTPENGFLPYRWEGYDEALLLYVLGLGSPTHALPPESYPAWLSTYEWKKIYGYELVYAGPLFIHQLSHLWIDFRGIHDAFMRDRASTTSRTAGVRRTSSNATPFATHSSRATANAAGGSPRATVRDQRRAGSEGGERVFYELRPGARRTGRTTARSHPGPRSHPCRSRRRSSCPRSSTFNACTPTRKSDVRLSRRASTPRFPHGTGRAAGVAGTVPGSATRARSS